MVMFCETLAGFAMLFGGFRALGPLPGLPKEVTAVHFFLIAIFWMLSAILASIEKLRRDSAASTPTRCHCQSKLPPP